MAVATLVIATAMTFIAPAAQADETVISDGTVTWGVKQSWRSYIGDSGITVAGGVTRTAGGAFDWPVESGTYDDATKTLELDLAGSVRFTAHEGALDMTITEPRLVISGDEPQLFADVVSRSESTGQMVDYGEIPMVSLDLETGSPTTTDGTTTWTPLDARLTAEMYEAFSRNYGVNSLLDPVSLSYVGPGAKPTITAENWLSSGSLVFEQSGSSPVLDATAVLPDQDNGVVHVATGTSLRAYDYSTMEPLGDAIPFAGDVYPAPVLHDVSGAVFANQGGQAKTFLWNPATKVYDVQVLNAKGMTQYSPSPTVAQIWGFNGTGVYRWVWQSGSRTYTQTEYPVTGLPTGRVGFAAVTSTNMVFAEASQKPFSLSIAGGLPSRTDLPGDYANPAGQFGFNYPTEVQVISSAEYVLSNYQGQIFRIQGVSGGFARIGKVIQTGMNGVLRSTIDRSTTTVYLADYAGQTVVAVKDGAYGLITAKDLGVWVLATLPVGANDGVLFVGASRTGGSGVDYGVRRYSFLGNSPIVSTQPKDALVALPTGQSSGATTFTVDGDLVDSIQWQSRPGSTGRFKDLVGETAKTLDVTATAVDEGRQYRAAFRNALGATVSDIATLTVHTAPSAVISPSDVAVTEGDDALFEVMPSGNPYPSITWQRRVGGYWTDLSTSDSNFRIDGGKLTVRSTNLEQSGSMFRAELSNVVETIPTKAARLTVSEPSDATRVIDSGDLDWGVKKSFRDYVVGPIAHGDIEVSDGATRNEDGTFAFPVGEGTYDPTTRTTQVAFDGTVQFTGHGDVLQLTISDPAVEITGDDGTLTAEVVSKDAESGTVKDFGRVAVAELDATGGVTAGGDVVRLAGVGATLTDVGAPAFGGFYAAGAALDDLDASLQLGDEVGVDSPSTTTVTRGRSAITYGTTTTVGVTVASASGAPTGAVTATVAGKTVRGSLSKGAARLTLPKGLRPGSHAVVVTYAGTAGVAPSRGSTSITVTKAAPTVRTTLSRSSVKASQRARLRVSASIPGATSGIHPTGQLVIRDGSRIVAVKTLKASHRGRLTVRLPRLARGRHHLKVTLAGSTLQHARTSSYRTLRVR